MQPASSPEPAAEPTARTGTQPRFVGLVVIGFIVLAVAFGLTGHWTAPFAARVLGQATNHSVGLLRLVGWLFGGLPWVVIGALVFTRPLLLVRGAVPYVLAVWIASNAAVLPGRNNSGGRSTDDIARRTFGAYAEDGRQLALGVGAGLLSIFVAFLGIGLVVKVLRGHGPFQHRSKPMTRAIEVWYFGWLAAGLVVALTVPTP